MSALIVEGTSSWRGANIGPWVDANNNVYEISVNFDTDDMKAFKASDPFDSWVERDTFGRPQAPAAYQHDTWQDGDEIHCIWWHSTDGEYQYHTFQTSDHASPDQWGIVSEVIEAPTSRPTDAQNYCAISVRSDGDIIVIYDGDTDNIMGTKYDRADYARKEAGWVVGINVAGQDVEADFHAAALVRGESDGMYITYFNGDIDTLAMKFLTSGNTLESIIHTWITDIGTLFRDRFLSAPQMIWNGKTGSDEKIYMSWLDSSDNFESNYAFWHGSGFTSGMVQIVATDQRTVTAGPLPVLSIDTITGKVFCVYVDTVNDLKFVQSVDGGLWTTTTLLETESINFTSCNIIDRGTGGKFLAVIFGNTSPEVRYLEFDFRPPQNIFLNQAVQRAANF